MKVKVVDAGDPMLNTPNTLLRRGGMATYTLAVDVFPVPPLEEVT